jgi:RNA polymerase sigma-70 factor (ECF subfamily)
VHAVKATSPADVATIVRDHQAEVWRYLRFLGASPELADDLAQETFVQLLRAPYVDRGPAARSAWLRTVARNLYLRSFRRPPFTAVDLDAIEATWTGFARDDAGESSLAELRACLEELDGRARDAVRLQYEERRSRSTIGAHFGIGSDGVKSMLRRVREVLRRCMQRRLAQ